MGEVKHTPPVGTLTDRVQFKRCEEIGAELPSFVPVCTMWARVRSVQPHGGVTHHIVIRFRGDVSPGDRIVYRGRNLDVVSAADLNGRRAYLLVQASEPSP